MGFLSDNFISEFIVTVIRWASEFIPSYALIIIILTLVIRLVLLPLDIKQKKNSSLMVNIGPEVESLKKRYANNPEQLNKKTQELYRERGIKPLAGCLPMLIQLILLFAFFGALRAIASEQSVSIILDAAQNGAQNVDLPQFLWVHNFWQADSGLSAILPSADEFLSFVQMNANYITPQTLQMLQSHQIISFAGDAIAVNTANYSALTNGIIEANNLVGLNNGWFGLPILSGAALFLQQKLMQKSNPTQAAMGGGKVMLYFFPLFSVYICATSPTSFAVYWVMSTVYSIVSNSIQDAIYNAKQKKNPVVA